MHSLFQKPQRVLIKVSGEVLKGDTDQVYNYSSIRPIAQKLIDIKKLGIEVSVVIGGGNIRRHRDNVDSGIPRHISDQIGICATVMNATVLVQAINALWGDAVCLSAGSIVTPHLSELYTANKGHQYLSEGKIVVCAGGTGHCYATTDSGATVRALELECDMLIKWTKVDGIYSKDPMKFDDAERFDTITYKNALNLGVNIMDHSAIALAMDNKLPIFVCKIEEINNILDDDVRGTYVHV